MLSSWKTEIHESNARFAIAILLWVLVCEIITALLFLDLPAANREIMIGLGGTIVGGLIQSSNYYNKTGVDNDRKKDEALNRAVETTARMQAQATPDVVPVGPGEAITVAATEGVTDGAGAQEGRSKETRKLKPSSTR